MKMQWASEKKYHVIAPAVVACLQACASADDTTGLSIDMLGRAEQEIINGNAVARGSLADRGVVQLFTGCTGTLLSNQHVLTARHCVRQWLAATGNWGTSLAPISVLLEGAVAADDQIIASSNVFEPVGAGGLNAGDYAIVELSAPMVVNDESNGFFNPIYGGTDAALVSQAVFCAGYGNNTEANQDAGTLGAGFGTLRTANLTVTSAGGNALTINRLGGQLGQVGAPGDSGSTCFFNNQITGVQSTCTGPSWDQNGDGQVQGQEWTYIVSCASASPNSHRAWTAQQVLANVSFSYTFAPASAQQHSTRVSAVNDTTNVSSTAGAINGFALRSGWIEVTVQNEPAKTLCTKIRSTVPIAGDAVLHGSCLGHGLLSVIVG